MLSFPTSVEHSIKTPPGCKCFARMHPNAKEPKKQDYENDGFELETMLMVVKMLLMLIYVLLVVMGGGGGKEI